MEEWKSVEGYEGFYEVSNHGRVRSLDRKVWANRGNQKYLIPIKGKVLKDTFDQDGYHMVSLYDKEGKQRTPKVHRLVLLTFVGSSNLLACHRNGNIDDNRLENLYWGTDSDNTQDQIRHGTHKETRKTHCPRHHKLVEPNLQASELKKGKRSCLSCGRAKNYLRRYDGDLQEISDRYYKKIMESLTCSLE